MTMPVTVPLGRYLEQSVGGRVALRVDNCLVQRLRLRGHGALLAALLRRDAAAALLRTAGRGDAASVPDHRIYRRRVTRAEVHHHVIAGYLHRQQLNAQPFSPAAYL